MALTAEAVRVAVTGELYTAPVGTTGPTSATSTLDPAWVGLGYVSEDGVTETNSDEVETIVAWQNSTVVRATRAESTLTYQLTLIETKGSVLELFHPGSQVQAVGAGQWKLDVVTPQADRRAFVLDIVDGTKHVRIYVPQGEVTERGEVTYANGEPIGYNVTITAYPDENNVLATKFSDDANWGYS